MKNLQEIEPDQNSENQEKIIPTDDRSSPVIIEKVVPEESKAIAQIEEISDSDDDFDLFRYNNPLRRKPQTSLQQKGKRDAPTLPVEPKTLPVPQPKISRVPQPSVKKEIQYDNIPSIGFFNANPSRKEKIVGWREELRGERDFQDSFHLPQKYKGPGLNLVKKFQGFLKRACQNQKNYIEARVLEKQQFSSTLSLVLVFVETDKIEMLKPSESRQIYIIMNERQDLLQPGKFLRIFSPALTSAFKFVVSDKRKYPGKLYMALEYELETNL